MRTAGLAGLPRRARRQGAIPVCQVEEVAIRRPVNLLIVLVVARVERRVPFAGTLHRTEIERRRQWMLERDGVQRAPALLLRFGQRLQLLHGLGERGSHQPITGRFRVGAEPQRIGLLQRGQQYW